MTLFQLYRNDQGPRFVTGHAVSMAFIAMSALIYILMWWWFRRQNQRKMNGEDDHKVAGMTEEEIEELGEHNPRFRYTY